MLFPMAICQCLWCEGMFFETSTCVSCGEEFCEDCLVDMTYMNQVDYAICEGCYDQNVDG